MLTCLSQLRWGAGAGRQHVREPGLSQPPASPGGGVGSLEPEGQARAGPHLHRRALPTGALEPFSPKGLAHTAL